MKVLSINNNPPPPSVEKTGIKIAVSLTPRKLPELEESVRSGRLYVLADSTTRLQQPSKNVGLIFIFSMIRVPDGKVCINAQGELAVTKFAVEPVSFACVVIIYVRSLSNLILYDRCGISPVLQSALV